MPIFEYLCVECARVTERLVFSEAETVECPHCGSTRMQKLLSVTSSASGVKGENRLPGKDDTGCCGSRPGTQGCVPGSCCGRT